MLNDFVFDKREFIDAIINCQLLTIIFLKLNGDLTMEISPKMIKDLAARLARINHDFANEASVLLLTETGVDKDFVKAAVRHLSEINEQVQKLSLQKDHP